MKSYTDLEQSKKLAEFLPLESADMCYGINDDTLKYNDLPWFIPYPAKEYYMPCWSLAALLNILPKNLNIGRPSLESNYKEYYWIQYYDEFMKPNNYTTECFNNPIDACVIMIDKLHKQNLI